MDSSLDYPGWISYSLIQGSSRLWPNSFEILYAKMRVAVRLPCVLGIRKRHLVDSFIGFGQIFVHLVADSWWTGLEFCSLQMLALRLLVRPLFDWALSISPTPYSNCWMSDSSYPDQASSRPDYRQLVHPSLFAGKKPHLLPWKPSFLWVSCCSMISLPSLYHKQS